MEIKKIDKIEEWNEFLNNNKHLIFHTPKYKEFLEKSFPNVKFDCLGAFDSGLKSILLIGVINHRILGKKIISVPFLEYGSFAGNEKYIKDILEFIRKNYDADYLEIRQGLDYDKELSKHLKKNEEYKRFVLELKNEEENWKLLDKQKKKAIRRAENSGVYVKELNLDDINEIYDIYLKNMKQFGSPPFYKEFFINFFDLGLGKVFGSFKEKNLISLILGFTYKDRIHAIIAVSNNKYLNFRPNEKCHWEFIKYGIKNGFKIFDLGKVRESSGQFRFKKEFGGKIMHLYHYYDLYKIKNIPKVDPTNKKYRLLIKTWKFLPNYLIEKKGPWIREGLGI